MKGLVLPSRNFPSVLEKAEAAEERWGMGTQCTAESAGEISGLEPPGVLLPERIGIRGH